MNPFILVDAVMNIASHFVKQAKMSPTSWPYLDLIRFALSGALDGEVWEKLLLHIAGKLRLFYQMPSWPVQSLKRR